MTSATHVILPFNNCKNSIRPQECRKVRLHHKPISMPAARPRCRSKLALLGRDWLLRADPQTPIIVQSRLRCLALRFAQHFANTFQRRYPLAGDGL